MSLLSIIGMILFILLLYGIKNTIINSLGSPEITWINPQTQKEEIIPATPPNYLAVFFAIVFGLAFLTFVMFGVVALWDTSLFGGAIKL